MVMVKFGMDNIQNQISDRSSEQQTLSGGQTLAAEIQNFINKDLAAVAGNGTATHPGAVALDWSKPGNLSNLQSMMKNISSLFYSNNTGAKNDTWGSMEIILPNGTTIPLMTENANGSFSVDPALGGFVTQLRNWMQTIPTTPTGNVNWNPAKNGNIRGLGSGAGSLTHASRLPSDEYASPQAAMKALFGMQPPLYVLLAFKKLQTLVDTDYKLTKADIESSGVSSTALMKLFGSFDSNAPLKGLKSLYNDMQSAAPVNINWDTTHVAACSFLSAIQFYTRAYYNDPMTGFWHKPALNDPVAPPINSSEQTWRDYFVQTTNGIPGRANYAMGGIFNVWGIQHYNNKNPPSGTTTSTTPQSPLDIIATDAGQVQTYSQSATQSNTAEIQQDIQTSQSEDKVVQSIVQQVSQSTSNTVKNQLVT
ncbi:MAG: hypothetical protein S4CHLAM107_11880 [Chlamydiia bacterium]|nr:hypothetical protein [Chlamydiia bacterium]